MQDAKEIPALSSSMRDWLKLLTVDYMNLVLGGVRKSSRRQLQLCCRLRDSATYRAATAEFHWDLLQRIDEGLRNEAMSTLDQDRHRSLMWAASQQEMYLVDDIIFHLVSLFDYLGNLTGFVFYGEPRSRQKWDGALKYCRDGAVEERRQGRTTIHDSRLAGVLKAKDAALVQHLQEYRAHLFHYRSENPTSRVRFRLQPESDGKKATLDVDLAVSVPPKMAKWVSKLDSNLDVENATLVGVTTEVLGMSLRASAEVVEALWHSLRDNPVGLRESARITL